MMDPRRERERRERYERERREIKEYPEEGQEVVIKYKISNAKGEILDSTEDRPYFKFIMGKYEGHCIIDPLIDLVAKMKRDEKKTLELDCTLPENKSILDLLPEDKKDLEENKKLTCEVELVRFSDVVRSILEVTDEEKFQHAQNLKKNFVEQYKQKNFSEGVKTLTEAIGVMNKINEVNKTEEMKKFKTSLLLNRCNCYNNLKEYRETEKDGNEVLKYDPKSMKAYYYLGNAYAYMDEFKEAIDCYKKLVELIPNKSDPGVLALHELISSRKKVRDEISRRKMKAYYAQRADDEKIEKEKKEKEEKEKEENKEKEKDKEKEKEIINTGEDTIKVYGNENSNSNENKDENKDEKMEVEKEEKMEIIEKGEGDKKEEFISFYGNDK